MFDGALYIPSSVWMAEQSHVKYANTDPLIWCTVSGANRCNAFHSDGPGAALVRPHCEEQGHNKKKAQVHEKNPTGKILEVQEGGAEKPRDGPVDEAVIKHQTEIAS